MLKIFVKFNMLSGKLKISYIIIGYYIAINFPRRWRAHVDEDVPEFVAPDRVCEPRPHLLVAGSCGGPSQKRQSCPSRSLLARFSTSQPSSSSSLTRSTRQWHGNSDGSRTARDDDDTKRPFPVAGCAAWTSFLPAHDSLPVPLTGASPAMSFFLRASYVATVNNDGESQLCENRASPGMRGVP